MFETAQDDMALNPTALEVIGCFMSRHANRKWRHTTVIKLDRTLAPFPDNWSLIDRETGIAVAQLTLDTGYQERPAWRVIC
jgi:hypothetical protein